MSAFLIPYVASHATLTSLFDTPSGGISAVNYLPMLSHMFQFTPCAAPLSWGGMNESPSVHHIPSPLWTISFVPLSAYGPHCQPITTPPCINNHAPIYIIYLREVRIAIDIIPSPLRGIIDTHPSPQRYLTNFISSPLRCYWCSQPPPRYFTMFKVDWYPSAPKVLKISFPSPKLIIVIMIYFL